MYIWSWSTTMTHCGTGMKSHRAFTVTGHQEDIESKFTSPLPFPTKPIAKLERTPSNGQRNKDQTQHKDPWNNERNPQHQSRRLRTDSSLQPLGHLNGFFYWRRIYSLDSVVVKGQNVFISHGGSRTYAMLRYSETIYGNQINTLWCNEEKGKRLTESQSWIKAQVEPRLATNVRQRQASVTNRWMKPLSKGRHWVRCLIPHRAFKEETVAINCDWDNHAYRLPHDSHAISNNFVTFNDLKHLVLFRLSNISLGFIS